MPSMWNVKNFKIVVTVIAAMTLIVSASFAADTSDILEQRGKQLRVAIDKKYKELYDTHDLTTRQVNTITPLVLQYIPVGISFDDAEKILRAAGFSISSHTGSHPLVKFAGGEEYNVLALINPYNNPFIDSDSLPHGTLVEISLTPPAPRDYTNISKLFAAFGIFNDDPFP